MITIIGCDVPPSSLMDSTMSPKVMIMKRGGVGARSLARNILGVEKACWSFGMGTRNIDKQINYLRGPTKTKQQVG